MAKWPYNTTAWKRLRRAKLAVQPLCEPCMMRGKLVDARAVDHIIAIAQGGEPFPGVDGLMSMCLSCHAVKTNARDNPNAFGGGGKVAFKGCGTDGTPIDPSHPFNGGGAFDHERPSTGDRRVGVVKSYPVNSEGAGNG